MGSFSMTCSVSGLGISVGTPVRCLLLTASPYTDDDPRKTWIVRTPPIRAVYNDYGSIDNVHTDDDFIAKLWLRGLREDVVEKGLGDNSCHDVPVAIDMSFDDMLAAIQGRRLQVVQDVEHFWRLPRGSHGEHVPSLIRRMEKMLEAQFPGQVSRHADKDKYVVDEPVPHMARVRFGQYQHSTECMPALEAAREAIEGCKTRLTGVVTAGSGRYGHSADLLVFPSPATDEPIAGPQWDTAADNKALNVGLAMIREDVWQALIAYPHCDYVSLDCYECGLTLSGHKKNRRCPTGTKYSRGPVLPADVSHIVEPREWSEYVWYGLDAYKSGTRSTWTSVLARFASRKCAGPPVKLNKHLDEEEDRSFFGDFPIRDVNYDCSRVPGAWAFSDSVPGVIGLSEHLSMLISDGFKAPAGLLDAVAELSAVQRVLGSVGIVLRPAVSSGPQSPEWGESMRFARTVLQIAEAAGKAHECEMPDPATLDEAFEIVANKAKALQAKIKAKSHRAKAKKKGAPADPQRLQEHSVSKSPRQSGKISQMAKWKRKKARTKLSP